MVYENGMTLEEVAEALKLLPPDAIIEHGFCRAHSYRGYYECIAFEPRKNVPVAQMLVDAKSAIGKVFHGYKGGQYRMDEDTEVYIARYGKTGEPLTDALFAAMTRDEKFDPFAMWRRAGEFEPVEHVPAKGDR